MLGPIRAILQHLPKGTAGRRAEVGESFTVPESINRILFVTP
jgi:hypothetical protein